MSDQNTKTFEVANGKDTEFKKTLESKNFLSFEPHSHNIRNRFAGPCMVREDAENKPNDLFIRYSGCGISLEEEDEEEIPIIYRGMRWEYLNVQIPIKVK